MAMWGRMPLPHIPICPQEPWEAQEYAHRDRSRVKLSFCVSPGACNPPVKKSSTRVRNWFSKKSERAGRPTAARRRPLLKVLLYARNMQVEKLPRRPVDLSVSRLGSRRPPLAASASWCVVGRASLKLDPVLTRVARCRVARQTV